MEASIKEKEGFIMAKVPSWPLISNGSSGKNVTALQCLLYYHGFNIAIDGIFGNGTAGAVRTFQQNHGLGVDGIAGQNTLLAMITTISSRTNNYAARAAQYLLSKFESLAVDGDFWTGSQTATETFQQKMGIAVTGSVNSLTWRYLFGYSAYPIGSGSSTITIKNEDYAGKTILSSSQIALLEANLPFYKKAQDDYGVPWQMLAALHYREYSLRKAGPSNGNGPYQIWGKSYPVGAYSDTQFQNATNDAAQFVLDKMNGISLTTDDHVKLAFFKYNGVAQVYKTQAVNLGFTSAQANNGEGSPYVMNRYDKKRDPTVEPTKSNGTWGQIKTDGGSLSYPANSDYGAFVIYKALC